MNPFAWYPPPPPGLPPPGMPPPFFCPPTSWDTSFWGAPPMPYPPPGRYPPPDSTYASADTYSQPKSYSQPAESYSQPAESYSDPAQSIPPAESYSQPAESYAQPAQNYSQPEGYPQPDEGYPPAQSYPQPKSFLPPHSYTSPAAWFPPAYGGRPQGPHAGEEQGQGRSLSWAHGLLPVPHRQGPRGCPEPLGCRTFLQACWSCNPLISSLDPSLLPTEAVAGKGCFTSCMCEWLIFFFFLYSEGGNGNFSQKWQGKQAPGFSKRCPEENNKPKVWSGVSSQGKDMYILEWVQGTATKMIGVGSTSPVKAE